MMVRLPERLSMRPIQPLALFPLFWASISPAAADTGTGEWSGELTASGTAERHSTEFADFSDSSRAKTTATLGYDYTLDSTTLSLEGEAGLFGSKGDGRDARITGAVRGGIKQQLGANFSAELGAGYSANVVTLESFAVNQKNVRGQLTWEKDKDRVQAFATHRWRDYQQTPGAKGKGWQFGARYRRHFGSYHWIEAGATRDAITDLTGRRGYQRTSFSLDYSRPVNRKLRILSSIEYRNWNYDSRHIGDVASAPLRSDRLTRVEAGLSYGKAKGFYARTTAGYDFKSSNDFRYSGNGPRAAVTIGFRF
jgi:hypothetical protein